MKSPEKNWIDCVDRLRTNNSRPEEYLSAWNRIFASWDNSIRPAPFACVDPTVEQQSNLRSFLNELDCDSYENLHQLSVTDPDAFWSAAIRRLGIVFRKPPNRILAESGPPELRQWLPGSQLNIVESCLQGDPQKICVMEGDDEGNITSLSREQLTRRVKQIGRALSDHGCSPGTPIAIFMPMDTQAVAMYLGIIYAGCVVVSIAESFAPAEVARRLEIAGVKFVITRDKYQRAGKEISLYEKICEATESRIMVLDRMKSTRLRQQDVDWNEGFTGHELVTEPHLGAANRILNILFSSGTTGDPKAIPWTHVTPIKCISDGHFHQDIRDGDIVAWPTSLGWMMGPWLIFATLANKACIALSTSIPTSRRFGEFIARSGCTVLGVVPTIVNAWRSSKEVEGLDWSSIRCFSSTGEASNPEAMRYLSALAGCKPIIEYCGGTEIGGGFISSTVLHPNVCGAFSCPALGNELFILDSEGQPCDEGELFLKPPALGMSQTLLNRDHHATYYHGTPCASDGVRLRRHGDFFQRLPGGYYVAGGRVDDTMNLGGIKTSSAEIERVLNRIPGIRETAAVAIPPPEGGPEELVVFAIVDLARQPSIDEQQLLQMMNLQLRAELNPLFRAKRVVMLESLPRTASNKVLRRELRDRLRGGRT